MDLRKVGVLKVVQELLATHRATISATLDTYSHVLLEPKKAAAAKLNALWRKEKGSSANEVN